MIKKIKGNIFNTNCEVIVNPVNCVGVMGKGLALEFKLLYPNMMDKYLKFCENKELEIGKIAIIKEENKKIILFPTKTNYSLPSKMEYIEKGLLKIKECYKEKGIKSIAFPQIGSGLGGLNWFEVESLIENILGSTDLEIELYSYSDEKAPYIENLEALFNNNTLEKIESVTKIKLKTLEKIKNNLSRTRNISDFLLVEGLGIKSVEKISLLLKTEIKIDKYIEQKLF